MIGSTISHYRITAKLGEGGMGVVYRARDERLDRDVAIKILPEEMARDAERLTRFEHEARAVAKLAHPNILQIHELGTHEDQSFMVTEVLEGQTLRERLEGGGSLGWRQAAEIGAAIADGLAAAHQAGIVHRDLKPSNVFLTSDGRVKMLDFGLARTIDVIGGGGDSDARTLTKCTAAGSVLGTVGYMSPEQVRGEPADGRSDIFALGCVLYEMVSGDRAFCRKTGVETMNAILKEDPAELARPDGDLPPELASTTRRCLEKGPEARFQSASDLAYNLRSISSSSGPGIALDQPRTPGWILSVLRPTLLAAALILAGIGIGWLLITRESPDQQATGDRSLAVVDFLDLANPDDPSRSAGLLGLLHVGLSESSPVRVVSPEALYGLRRQLFGSRRGPIDDEQALEVARRAGASTLLSGQMGGAANDPYITWRLVDAQSGEIRGAGRVQGAAQTALADQVVVEVIRLLAVAEQSSAPVDIVSVSTLTTTSPEAYEQYVAGELASEEIREKEAHTHFMQAVAIDSTFALAHFALSRSWHIGYEFGTRRGHMERAWRHRDKLSTRDRLLLEAWRIRFIEHPVGDYYAEAKRVYEEALARWPGDRDALLDYTMFLSNEWSPETLPAIEKGMTLFPDDQEYRMIYGQVLRACGQHSESLASTRKYLDLNPDIANTWDEMGWSFMALGLPDSAEHYFRGALDIDPQFFYSRWGLVCVAYARGERDQVIEVFEELMADTTLTVSKRRTLAWALTAGIGVNGIYFDQGRFDDYFDFVRRETARGTPYLYEENAYWYMDRFDLVLQSVDSTLAALGPDTPEQRTVIHELAWRSIALCGLDSLDEAQATYERLLAMRPDSSPYLTALAGYPRYLLELARGDAEAALATMTEIRRHNTYRWSYLDALYRVAEAEALRAAGRPEEAVAALEELLRLYGGHFVAHYRLGRIYEEMDRPADAEREYETFLAAWSQADEGLFKLEDARRRLAGLRSRQ